MNYLDLCRRVREDSGVSGNGPASVVGQTGIMQRIVNWVSKANDEIQIYHDDWLFLNYFTTQSLTAQTAEYPLADWSGPRLRTLKAVFVAGNPIKVVPYHEWLNNAHIYASGQTGTPTNVTLTPDQNLIFFPTPNADAPVTIVAFKLPTQLLLNGDESVIPPQYHEAIVARALMFYADYEEDPYRYSRASQEYENWLRTMTEDQLPPVKV